MCGFNIIFFVLLVVLLLHLGIWDYVALIHVGNKVDVNDRGGIVGILFIALAIVSFSCTGLLESRQLLRRVSIVSNVRFFHWHWPCLSLLCNVSGLVKIPYLNQADG
jgi:hypothetical protein